MEININNVLESVPPKSTLYDLVTAQTKANTQGIAVAINEHVIPRAQWTSTPIHPNDQILIIKATQGG